MSFSSSSSSYHDEVHTPLQSPPPVNRKIRFAPLPDPRRSVLITDDGEELFLPDDLQKPASLSDILPKPTFPLDDSSASASSLSSPPSESDYASPSPPLCPSPLPPQPAPTPQPRQASPPPMKRTLPPAKSRLSFFRLNKKSPPGSSSSSSSSSHTLTPTTSIDNGSATPTNAARPSSSHSPFSRFNFSTEEILTLGTINLFRPSSRTSEYSGHQSDSGVGGWGLNRWTSRSSFGKPKSYGSPLARAQSAEPSSVKTATQLTKSVSLPTSVSPSTKTASAPKKPTPLPYGRKGTRLLNGRVYGAPKNRNNQNVNPFANARDDDEFVEWGYGGMGSVRGARSAGVIGNAGGTRWERLAQSGNVSVFGVDEKKGVGGVGENDDDGSGMSWVRKRRAAKEQAMRELDEREKAEATVKAAANDSASTTATDPIPPTAQTSSAGDSAARTASPPPPSESAAATDTSPSMSDITTTVTNTATSPSISANSSAPFPTSPSTPALARSPSTISSTKPSSNEINMSSNPEHILTAVTIPARMPRHRRVLSRTTSMTGSVNASGETVTSASTTSQVQDALAVPGPSDKFSATPTSATPLEEKLEEQSESDSETESDSDSGRRKNGANGGEDDDEDEDEDDEEAGAEEAKRRTALGAGVEKISRHN